MFSKILYPTDFSDSAQNALEYVKKLKDAGTKDVIVVHVFEKGTVDLLWEAEAEFKDGLPEEIKGEVLAKIEAKINDKLKELEEELKDMNLNVETVLVEGIPYKEIVKVAKDRGVSLIVMGSHGEKGFIERFIGSTAVKVLNDSPVPVLIVKPIK